MFVVVVGVVGIVVVLLLVVVRVVDVVVVGVVGVVGEDIIFLIQPQQKTKPNTQPPLPSPPSCECCRH